MPGKSELADRIAARGWSKSAATSAVDAVLDEITAALAVGERVTLTGFGTFEAAPRPGRTARNPRTGATVEVAATTVARFHPGATLRTRVADGGTVTLPPLPAHAETALRGRPSLADQGAAVAGSLAGAATKARAGAQDVSKAIRESPTAGQVRGVGARVRAGAKGVTADAKKLAKKVEKDLAATSDQTPGAKAPAEQTATAKKPVAKKPAPKKSAPKKAAPKNAVPKKSAPKKAEATSSKQAAKVVAAAGKKKPAGKSKDIKKKK